jgi:hypothetical protein
MSSYFSTEDGLSKGPRMSRAIRLFAILALSVTVGLFSTGAATAATSATNTTTVPIAGSTATGGAVSGTFEIDRIVRSGSQLLAAGTLTATITDAAGIVVGTVTQQLQLPVTLQQGQVCTILELTLGPLDLNLLGLRVQLDEVHLLITAVEGPGNLLGNLLCAIAGLLDNTGASTLNAIVALLNRILGLLG